jgi:hypothetical protein
MFHVRNLAIGVKVLSCTGEGEGVTSTKNDDRVQVDVALREVAAGMAGAVGVVRSHPAISSLRPAGASQAVIVVVTRMVAS